MEETAKTATFKSLTRPPSAASSTSSQSVFDCGQPYGSHHPKQVAFSKQLLITFAANSLPHRLVADADFANLIKIANPRLKLPNRRSIGKNIDLVVDNLKHKIRRMLSDAEKVTICTDVWSRPGLSASYLGIAVHFFDRNTFQVRRIFIGLPELHDSHTGKLIKDKTDICLSDWHINATKVRAYVTDSGSNMKSVLRLVMLQSQ